jgi:ATP-dependent phosphoenolpyruvate carboxykinase
MSISLTRKIINSINNGELSQFPTKVHEYTGLSIPQCDILIPNDVMQPELSWNSLSEYKNKLSSLQEEFEKTLCPS